MKLAMIFVMKLDLKSLKRTTSALMLGALITASTLHPSYAARTVFDPWNYRQNILSAVRSLSQVNQQIQQLRNEAQVILKMNLDLRQLGSTVSPELSRTLGEIKSLMNEGNAIGLKVRETNQAMQALFPDEFAATITGNDVIQDAKARWDETLAAYKRSATLQAKISQTVDQDAALLNTLLGRSRSSVGNLQSSQTGNELTGLSVKQSLQLQQLMAAQYRAETFERSRKMAAEEEARVRFNSFLGNRNTAYSTSN